MENSANDVNDIKPITGLYTLKVAHYWWKEIDKKFYYNFMGIHAIANNSLSLI